ncbi:hypothetical protein [Streptomyces lydicus]|uniref:Uncharacterized protein n=1 Tax=Streptomyces lydicus TaxID=47763 RepID=A0A1D7VML9_9ACTN|nr:hypothetical protein [Streptomyces lydicus]AOP47994.1 hypothetical protein SL103_18735 [Streptomyces lydicus]
MLFQKSVDCAQVVEQLVTAFAQLLLAGGLVGLDDRHIVVDGSGSAAVRGTFRISTTVPS